MTSEIEQKLAKLGITLPTPGAPQASYVPTVQTGNLVFVSGQVPTTPEGVKFIGKVGREFSVEEGQQAARICAINVLANLKVALGGDLGRVRRIVKLVGFVNATPDFTEAHKVINGGSDFLIEILGDKGRHARSAIGMGSLPLGVAVEIEVVAEVA